MKLYIEIIKLIFNKLIRRKKTGIVLRDFCERMGVVYIKFAQILATQNVGNLFTEDDRIILSKLCDDVNPISFDEIKEIIENEYNTPLENIFSNIDTKPLGSASISQVHKGALLSGEEVAIKVKREDITNRIEKDLNKIKKIIHRYGKIVNFKNLLGGDKALELYFKWIYEEIDFNKEKNNIKTYDKFAKSVNGKIIKNKDICVPKVYEKLCTENIIVMEYINHKTINKIELNENNKKIICNAINSYLSSCFYALYHDQKIVFHGDPHGGNIYLDNNGNIGFLDMGLIFELSESDAKLTREFFLCAYSGNYEKLYNMLISYANMNEKEKEIFKSKIKDYIEDIKTKPVTKYFTDMINICVEINISPPTFLFSMAKAFICLDGISVFSNNMETAKELLEEQTIEYFINRSVDDCKNIIESGITLGPKLISNTLKYGFVKGLSEETMEVIKLRDYLKETLNHYEEIIDTIKN